MFDYKSVAQQALDLRRENAALRAALEKARADIEYIGMMSDIGLDMEETEVDSDEQEF